MITAKGHNGTVEFDGDFVTINRTGALARLTVGKGAKRIPLGSISAVQLKPAGALVNGFISFSMAGGTERRSTFGSQTTDAVNDENSVIITKKQMPEFEALRAEVEQAIAERSRPVAAAPAAGLDPMEQLAKLAELHRAGVVSDEEFAAKKAQLLG